MGDRAWKSSPAIKVIDPENPRDIKRVLKSIDYSNDELKPFRKERTDTIKQHLGYHYNNRGSKQRMPLNLIELVHNTYLRNLIARSPRAHVSTFQKSLKAEAADLELALNRLFMEIDLENTLQLLASDGLYCMGIAHVGTADLGEIEVDGFTHDVGQVFVDSISLDDFVIDMTARRVDQVRYMGHYSILDREYILESGLFENTDDLESPASTRNRQLAGGATKDITRGKSVDDKRAEDGIEVLNLWLPRENKVVILRAGETRGDRNKAIRIQDYIGPENGPYPMLKFNEINEQLIPLSPLAALKDMNWSLNTVWRKVTRQAHRQKDVGFYSPAADEDAKRIVDSIDGGWIRTDNPQGTNVVKYGGADQRSIAFGIMTRDLASYFMGNIDSLGGLGPQADTVGQEQIIAQSASQRMASMQDQMKRFTKRIIKDVAWHLKFNGQFNFIPISKKVPGTSMTIEKEFDPGEMEGDFLDYNFEIVPYSMQEQTPRSKLQSLTQILQGFVFSNPQMLESQGLTVDFNKLMSLFSEWLDNPELLDVIIKAEPDANQRQPTGERPRQSPNTTRTNIRVNRPGATRQGKDDVMARILSGAGVQGSEAASLMRPTG